MLTDSQAAVFSADQFIFFSYHPLLQSAGILFLIQAILVLQPTATAKQKKEGTWVHSTLNGVGVGLLVAGLVVIEINKGDHPKFTSAHGRLGLITFILIGLQAVIGVLQYYLPQLIGGEENGKALYKYHR